MKFPWVTLFPLFLGTRKNCRVHLDDRNGHFPCVACPAASDLRGSGEVEIPIIPRFQGNQGLVMLETPKIKEAKVAKAEKDAKKPKKQSNTKCINFFYPKKNVPVPSHSVSFPPSHRGNCLTLEKLPTQKSCRPKKNAPNKKNSPVFFVTRKLPRVGFVGSFSSPSPSSRDQRIQSNLIRSTGLSQLLGWKKPIPVESYDYLLLLKPDFFWVEKSRTIKKQLIRFGGLHIYIYIYIIYFLRCIFEKGF